MECAPGTDPGIQTARDATIAAGGSRSQDSRIGVRALRRLLPVSAGALRATPTPGHQVRRVLEQNTREIGVPPAIHNDNGPPYASVGLGERSYLGGVVGLTGDLARTLRAHGHSEQNVGLEVLHRALNAETARRLGLRGRGDRTPFRIFAMKRTAMKAKNLPALGGEILRFAQGDRTTLRLTVHWYRLVVTALPLFLLVMPSATLRTDLSSRPTSLTRRWDRGPRRTAYFIS